MLRRTITISLEIAALLAAALGAAAVLLAWQLAAGPVPLGFFTGTLSSMVNDRLSGIRVSLGDMEAIWQRQESELIFRLDDVRLIRPGGQTVVTIPRLDVVVDNARLTRGRLALASIEFTSVSIVLTRNPSGNLTLGFPVAGADEAGVLGGMAFVNALLRPGEVSRTPGALSSLRHLGVREAALTVIDEETGLRWQTSGAHLELDREADRISGLLDIRGSSASTGAPWHLRLRGVAPAGKPGAELTMQMEGIAPSVLAAFPALEGMEGMGFPVAGTAALTLGDNGQILAGRADLTASGGTLALPGLPVWPLRMARLQAHLPHGRPHVQVRQISLDAGGNRISLTGEMEVWQNAAQGARPDFGLRGFHLRSGPATLDLAGITDGPLQLDSTELHLRLDDDARTISVERAAIAMPPMPGAVAGSREAGSREAGSREAGSREPGNPGEEDGVISVAGTVRYGASSPAPASPAMTLAGRLGRLEVSELLRAWPLPLAPGARAWVRKNISRGRVESADFRMAVAHGVLAAADAGDAIPDDALTLEFEARGLSATYLDTMPPLENVTGRGLVRGDSFEAVVSDGYIPLPRGGILRVDQGRIQVADFHKTVQPGRFEANLSGRAADLLTLLNMEPVNLLASVMSPEAATGRVRAGFSLSLPLLRAVPLEEIDWTAKIRGSGLGLDLTDLADGDLADAGTAAFVVRAGALDFDADPGGFTASGQLLVNGVPVQVVRWRESFTEAATPTRLTLRSRLDSASLNALNVSLGPVKLEQGSADTRVDMKGSLRRLNHMAVHADLTEAALTVPVLDWRKPPQTSAMVQADVAFLPNGHTRVTLKEGTPVAAGDILLDDQDRIVELNLPVIRLGPENDLAIHARSFGPVTAWRVTGRRASIRTALARARGSADQGTAGAGSEPQNGAAQRGLVARVSLEQAVAHHGVLLLEPELFLMRPPGRGLATLEFSGRVAQDGGDGAPVGVSFGADADGRLGLEAHAGDVGALLRGLNATPSILDGRMDITAHAAWRDREQTLDGVLTAEDFRVVNAPILAQLLTLASLTGIGDTLQGEGILFEKLDVPFRAGPGSVRLEHGRVNGSALGFTVQGAISASPGLDLDLTGSLIPAFTLNSLLAQVPLVGPLMGGDEGLLGFTYLVRGPAQSPEVFVNLASIAAPGFLRRLFQFSEGDTPGADASPGAPGAERTPDGNNLGEEKNGGQAP